MVNLPREMNNLYDGNKKTDYTHFNESKNRKWVNN